MLLVVGAQASAESEKKRKRKESNQGKIKNEKKPVQVKVRVRGWPQGGGGREVVLPYAGQAFPFTVEALAAFSGHNFSRLVLEQRCPGPNTGCMCFV